MLQWKHSWLAAILLFTCSISPVFAADKGGPTVSGNVTAVSTYIWRGIAQTVDAALQGGVDYSTAEGIHAGVWTSNVAYGSELDFTVGFAGSAKGISYDAGLIVYMYPGLESDGSPFGDGDYNFNELYASITKDFINLGIYISGEAGNYIEVNADFPKVVGRWNLGLHFGSYDVDEDFDGLAYTLGDNYTDYSASLGTKIDGIDVSFTLSNTSIDDDAMQTVVKVSKDF